MDESKKHLSVRTSPTLASLANPECVPAPDRSEERRVGKEC